MESGTSSGYQRLRQLREVICAAPSLYSRHTKGSQKGATESTICSPNVPIYFFDKDKAVLANLSYLSMLSNNRQGADFPKEKRKSALFS